MSESLRDQLLRAGFKPPPKPKANQWTKRKSTTNKSRDWDEPGLAKAFAMRAAAERAECKAAERSAQEKARAKRERKRAMHELMDGQGLNRNDAEYPRHFEFAQKIRRVYVTPGQWRQLNAGEIGVVMHAGRALLVTRDAALRAQAIAPGLVALLVDPDAAPPDDGVPDDLMW